MRIHSSFNIFTKTIFSVISASFVIQSSQKYHRKHSTQFLKVCVHCETVTFIWIRRRERRQPARSKHDIHMMRDEWGGKCEWKWKNTHIFHSHTHQHHITSHFRFNFLNGKTNNVSQFKFFFRLFSLHLTCFPLCLSVCKRQEALNQLNLLTQYFINFDVSHTLHWHGKIWQLLWYF